MLSHRPVRPRSGAAPSPAAGRYSGTGSAAAPPDNRRAGPGHDAGVAGWSPVHVLGRRSAGHQGDQAALARSSTAPTSRFLGAEVPVHQRLVVDSGGRLAMFPDRGRRRVRAGANRSAAPPRKRPPPAPPSRPVAACLQSL